MSEAARSLTASAALPARAHAALESFGNLMAELAAAAGQVPLGTLMNLIADRTGYREMLTSAGTPEADSRLENLDELVNAAVEAAARGEGPAEFLDHAALVSDLDRANLASQVSLLTIHNAKGLEWPVVIVAGLEEGLFPHARALEAEAQMEEERRLCYVAMTRAEKRLILTSARARRRFGGGSLEPRRASRFLQEIPARYVDRAGAAVNVAEMDLFVERHVVRETARRNTYTGKTYNSMENIAQFFEARGMQPPPPKAAVSTMPAPAPATVKKPAAPKRPGPRLRAGAAVDHPRYGRGTLLRREGEGDEAKLTISFPGHGLKKLIAKYAGLKIPE